jgi:hypothetical protein
MCNPCSILLVKSLLENQTLPRDNIDPVEDIKYEFTSENFGFININYPVQLDEPLLAVSSATLGHIYVYYVDSSGPNSITVTLRITNPSSTNTINTFTFDIPASFGNADISGSNVFIGTLNATLIPGSILTVFISSTAFPISLAPIVVTLGP